jgi:hypothetical protein
MKGNFLDETLDGFLLANNSYPGMVSNRKLPTFARKKQTMRMGDKRF